MAIRFGGTALSAALLLLACGGDSETPARPTSMLASAGRAEADAQLAVPLVPTAPVVEEVRLRPARPAPGRIVQALARVSDADSDPSELRYEWRTSTGRVLGSERHFDTTGLSEGERLELVVTASDGERESEPHVVSFRLAEPSVEISLVGIDAEEGAKPGSVLEAVVETTDRDRRDYEILYEWSVEGEVVGTDEDLDTASLAPGDVVVLSARLQLRDRTTEAVRSRPMVLTRGEPPQILSRPVAGLEQGVFRYQMQATSPESGAEIRYAVSEGPQGLSVDEASGLVTWRPTPDQRGAFEIEVVASDQWGTGVAQRFELRLEDPAPPASAR